MTSQTDDPVLLIFIFSFSYTKRLYFANSPAVYKVNWLSHIIGSDGSVELSRSM